MRGTIPGHPDNFLSHAQQRPTVANSLRQLYVDEEIRDLHGVTVHAKWLEAVTIMANT